VAATNRRLGAPTTPGSNDHLATRSVGVPDVPDRTGLDRNRDGGLTGVYFQEKEKAMTEVKDAPKTKTTNGQGQTKDIAPQTTPAIAKANGSPFTFMRRFAEEMDRLFEDFGLETGWHLPSVLTRGRELLRREVGFVPAEWSPKIDVLEREGQFVVRTDLPGMSKEDVKVDVTDEMLTIHGERKEEKKEEREGCYYSERRYGSFYRAIPLPEGVDAAKATADFHKGVLEITMPAAARPEAKTRRIEVRGEK
jgi:HSP20 family protein